MARPSAIATEAELSVLNHLWEHGPSVVRENAERGKYARRYAAGTNIVRLAPDVAAAFPDEKAVNDALRFVMQIADDAGRLTGRST